MRRRLKVQLHCAFIGALPALTPYLRCRQNPRQLRRAVAQRVKIVTTLSRCPGIAQNAHALTPLGAEIVHSGIP